MNIRHLLISFSILSWVFLPTVSAQEDNPQTETVELKVPISLEELAPEGALGRDMPPLNSSSKNL